VQILVRSGNDEIGKPLLRHFAVRPRIHRIAVNPNRLHDLIEGWLARALPTFVNTPTDILVSVRELNANKANVFFADKRHYKFFLDRVDEVAIRYPSESFAKTASVSLSKVQ
jgi:hypothetical protein